MGEPLRCPQCDAFVASTAMACDRGHRLVEAPPRLDAHDAAPSFAGLVPLPPNARTRSSWYVMRHLRGEQSLGWSFWINGALANAISGGIFAFTAALGTSDDATLERNATNALAALALVVLVWCWLYVGLWTAASKHRERGGSAWVAVLVQALVIFWGTSALVTASSTRVRQHLVEMIRLASNDDPLPPITVQKLNDSTLLLEGSFGQGSAKRVKRALINNDALTTIHLSSPGGRVLEAKMIARAIHKRRLNTYVDSACASACTIVLLAGADRGATPEARIGFHRPSFSGLDSTVADVQDMSAAYRTAGLQAGFIDRIMAVASDDLWFPTHTELIDNGVITRVAQPGETASWGRRMHSIDDLRSLLLDRPVWAAAAERFSARFQTALETTWQAVERGEPDGLAASSLHTALQAMKVEALHAANDEQLDRYLTLMRETIGLLREHHPELCRDGLRAITELGSLNPSDPFVRAAMELEEGFAAGLIASDPRGDLARPSKAAALNALRRAHRAVPHNERNVLEKQHEIMWPDGVLCTANVAFLDAIASLPPGPRSLAVRHLSLPQEATAQAAPRRPREVPQRSAGESDIRKTQLDLMMRSAPPSLLFGEAPPVLEPSRVAARSDIDEFLKQPGE